MGGVVPYRVLSLRMIHALRAVKAVRYHRFSFAYASSLILLPRQIHQMAAKNASTTTATKLVFPSLPHQLRDVYKPGQMLTHQSKVARLPVPPLQQTLSKYLRSVEVSDSRVTCRSSFTSYKLVQSHVIPC